MYFLSFTGFLNNTELKMFGCHDVVVVVILKTMLQLLGEFVLKLHLTMVGIST